MEIKILTSNSTLPVLNALIPAYEKSSGNTVAISADSAKAMVARIRGGETGDVLVLGNGAVKELSPAVAALPEPSSASACAAAHRIPTSVQRMPSARRCSPPAPSPIPYTGRAACTFRRCSKNSALLLK
jgi:hypothetical protein